MAKLVTSPPLQPLDVELLEKVGAGQVGEAQALIRRGACPNVRDDQAGGETPLHLAAKQANLAMTQMLLAEGAEILDDHERTTPIQLAVAWMQDSPAIVSALLDHLRGNPADVLRDALIKASARNIHDIMDILLARGADPFSCPEGTNYRAVDHIMGGEDDVRSLNVLLKHRGAQALAMEKEQGWTLLFMAAAAGAPKKVQRLLDYGFSANTRCPVGATPMHDVGQKLKFLIKRNEKNGDEARERRKIAIAQTINILLQEGRRVDDRNDYGVEALHNAAGRADAVAVAAFLAAGANPNSSSINGQTPLHHASLLSQDPEGRLQCVHLLLAQGAEAWRRDDQGKTAADYAEELMWGEGGLALRAAAEQQVLEQQIAQPRTGPKSRL